jgi:osmoprotectant transport system permease protein
VILAQSSQPFVRWDWIGDHTDDISERLIEHIQLTAIAVIVGLMISVPLALLAFRYRRTYAPITWVTGILYTIPSLALFVILLPYTGISYWTAEIGLVSYTLLILIRNIVAGLDGVPADAVETAQAMGYTERQIMWRVRVPLALPVIIAGVRIATVTTIGLVTVTALVGLGGVGYFILVGISRFFSTAAFLGAALSLLLAVAFELLFLGLQRLSTPWSRKAAVRGVA